MNYKEHQSPELAIMRYVLMLLLFFLVASGVFAQSQPQPAPSLPDDLYRTRDLDIKERAAWISALGTGVPILLGVITFMFSIFQVKKTVVAQFAAKAAELALQGEGRKEVLNRADLLARMYPKLLSTKFRSSLEQIESDAIGPIATQRTYTIAFKAEVIKLLAAHPQQREQILTDYAHMFTGDFISDKWKQLKCGSALNQSESKTNPTSPQLASDQSSSQGKETRGYFNHQIVKGVAFVLNTLCLVTSVVACILAIWEFAKPDVLWRTVATCVVVAGGMALLAVVNRHSA